MKTSSSTSERERGSAAVVVGGLSMHYGRKREVEALTEIDLEVRSHELLVVLGPSGCGKTTLLRCVAGLEVPTGGEIHIGGETVFRATPRRALPPNKRDIGMVFQNYALWPHMTVQRNVEYPLRAQRKTEELRSGRAAQVLALVRCAELADRYPPQLSGGQQQRVALARGLAAKPQLMLFDEPLSNLDAQLRVELRAEIRRLHEEVRFSGIYVTHDQIEAFQLADVVAVMEKGRVVQLARPEDLYRAPASPYVAGFLGIRNRIDLVAGETDGPFRAGLASAVSTRFGVSPSYELFLREELLSVAPPSVRPPAEHLCFEGVIQNQLFAGERVELVVTCDSHLLRCLCRLDAGWEVGDVVRISLHPDDCLVYQNGNLVPSTNRAGATTNSVGAPVPRPLTSSERSR